MATKRLGIEQLTIDSRLQARVTINQDAVDEYTEAYLRGDKLPPLEVVYDKSTASYYVVDGYHRHPAAVKAKVAKLDCNVTEGNFTFALIAACGANASHGVRRSNEDKRKAVRVLLEHEETAGQTDNWIAAKCHVSNHMVKAVRDGVQPGILQVEHGKRQSQDGKSRPSSPSAAAEQRAAVAEAVAAKPDATVREIAEETGASVGTVQAVKTSPAASIVLDGLEQQVPAELREAHGLSGPLMALARTCDRIRKESLELSEKRGGEFVRMQDIDGAVRELKGLIADSRYHCQCPDCDPGKRRKNCKRCHGAGFLPHYQRGMISG